MGASHQPYAPKNYKWDGSTTPVVTSGGIDLMKRRIAERAGSLDPDGLMDVASAMLGRILDDPPRHVEGLESHDDVPTLAGPKDPWEALGLIARLIVVQHLLELGLPIEVKGLMDGGLPRQAVCAESIGGMSIVCNGRLVRFHTPSGAGKAVSVFEDMLQDLDGSWIILPWTQSIVLSKLMIELVGLDAHDFETVMDYSRSQHGFVLSCVAMSIPENDDSVSYREVESSGFGRIDLFFDTLMRDCRAGDDQHGALDGDSGVEGLAGDGGMDGSAGDANVSHGVVGEDGDGLDRLRLLLIRAVYGACRFRRCNGLYDADHLSYRLGCRFPLSLQPPEVEVVDPSVRYDLHPDYDHAPWHEYHGLTMESFFFDSVIDNNSGTLSCTSPGWAALDVWKTRIGRYNRYNDDDWVGRVGWDDTCLESSVLTMIPEDLRPACTMDRLRGIEAKTHVLRGFLIMSQWSNQRLEVGDALRRISWYGPEARMELLSGMMDTIGDRAVCKFPKPYQSRDGNGRPLVTRLVQDERPELSHEDAPLVIDGVWRMSQIGRFMADLEDVRSDPPRRCDPFGGMGLLDILLVMSMFCVLEETRFSEVEDVTPLDRESEWYEALVDGCRVVYRGCDTGSKFLRAVLGGPSGRRCPVADVFDDWTDLMAETVLYRLAGTLGSMEGGALPKDFLLEDITMQLTSGFEEAVLSHLPDVGS